MAGYLVTDERKVTTHRLMEMKQRGEKISVLTAYDFTTASILDRAGVDAILIGCQTTALLLICFFKPFNVLPARISQFSPFENSFFRLNHHNNFQTTSRRLGSLIIDRRPVLY